MQRLLRSRSLMLTLMSPLMLALFPGRLREAIGASHTVAALIRVGGKGGLSPTQLQSSTRRGGWQVGLPFIWAAACGRTCLESGKCHNVDAQSRLPSCVDLHKSCFHTFEAINTECHCQPPKTAPATRSTCALQESVTSPLFGRSQQSGSKPLCFDCGCRNCIDLPPMVCQ